MNVKVYLMLNLRFVNKENDRKESSPVVTKNEKQYHGGESYVKKRRLGL